LAENPELRESLDGDYYRSNWDKSGVVEADCFVCHFRRYNFEERIHQLEIGNYQWAVVSATGMGIVEGAVVHGENPTIPYNKRFFNNEDGSITLWGRVTIRSGGGSRRDPPGFGFSRSTIPPPASGRPRGSPVCGGGQTSS
jgi:hypothetical protein